MGSNEGATAEDEHKTISSFLFLRFAIGVMAFSLPFMVVYLNCGRIISSISQYYDTTSSVYFTTTIAAMGLFLISYKGYDNGNNRFWGDNFITTIGGIRAIVLVSLPTALNEGNPLLESLVESGGYLRGHTDSLKRGFHLGFAGLLVASVGWMSFSRFTKGKHTWRNRFYKAFGIIILISMLGIVAGLFFENIFAFPNYIFWWESIALWAFGISGFIKERYSKAVYDNTNTIKKPPKTK
ncbi:MAG: hypothetical protein HRT71_13015 [Flavobacteriales bacterium]|nr:hypothetical protein [Flavobacteriales bacterium]